MAEGRDERHGADRVDRLLTRLKALPESAMRLAVLTEEVTESDDGDAVELLAGLMARAARRPSLDHQGALALIPGEELARRLGYERVSRLYREARQRGHTEVCQLFLAAGMRPNEESGLLAPPRGETLTLGERKALARRLPRQKLDRLLADPNPDVVENLLRNPAMTEREVLRVTSRRPVHPDVLLRVFANPRWSNRYRVRKALIYNPNTPIQISLNLVTFLSGGDLAILGRDPGVHALVRERARAVLRRRGERAGSPPLERAASPDDVVQEDLEPASVDERSEPEDGDSD
ncbi:MAG: hypothetical protein U0610_08970 [bacterium]